MQLVRLNKTTLWGRLPVLLFCAAALLSATSGVYAQGGSPQGDASAGSAGPAASRKAAADLLNRIHEAAQQQNYEGTFVYQRGTTVQSSRITHSAARGDGEYESLESLDGKPRKMLRHDDDMYTFVPERLMLVVEKRQNKDSFPSLLATGGH